MQVALNAGAAKQEGSRLALVGSSRGSLEAAWGSSGQAVAGNLCFFVVGQSHCGKARWRGRDWRFADREMVVGPS
jgi:hypothetical protein